MTRLRDLEELLLSIEDRKSREYMEEAVRCYHAEAHRAAIVAAFAAAMDYLRRRLAELIQSGSGSSDLRRKFESIEKVFKEQKSFEYELIDVCEKSAGMLTPSEAKLIRSLLETRHLAAHPSGYVANAETARACVATLADLVLSRPLLLGISEAKLLVDRLQSPSFFPDSYDSVAAVRHEASRLHQSAYPALVVSVIDRLKENAEARAAAVDAVVPYEVGAARRNMVAFLSGLAAQSIDTQDVVARHARQIVETDSLSSDLVLLLESRPELYGALDELTRHRALATLRAAVSGSAARNALSSLRKLNLLTADDTVLVSSDFEYTDISLASALELDWPELHRARIERVLSDAGSSWRLTSAKAINSIQGLSDSEASKFIGKERALYPLQVSKGASWEARQLAEKGLSSRADFLDDLGRAMIDGPQDVISAQPDWSVLVDMIVASKRADLLANCLALWESPAASELVMPAEALSKVAANGDDVQKQRAQKLKSRKP
ncbi:hypothetical protein [Corallococcus sp. CA049B]|uniref:hypothetical protein n=1 Tax=Corallococcus sp. CA049B TaxID=2316730 RepID=UPI0011C40B10|nr:hypothetical protein [Corallococcus sp. CA049B]